MNLPLFKRVIARVTHRMSVLAGVAALCSVLALAQDASQSDAQRTDGQIEMDVVHALDASQPLKNDLITAATIQGQVTLAGTVSSEDSKKLAESIVKGVPGVTGVKNNLKVGNPADDANAQMPQEDDSPVADNQQPSAPPTIAPAPDNGQNAPPDNGQQPQYGQPQQQPQYGRPQQPQYGQPQPGYGQPQQPTYGQQQPGYGQPAPPPYGQPAPPPQYGQQAPPPPYGQPGYGQSPYPPQYAPAPAQPSYRFSNAPITVPPGTVIQLRTTGAVDSKHAQPGEALQFTVIQDVVFGGVLAIPRGATVNGVLADVQKSQGKLTGSDELALQLTSLELGGQTYPLESDQFKIKGPGKGERSAGNIIGGTVLGAIIGGAAGGGTGAAIGAVAGGTVGTAASAATSSRAWIPAEALVTFRLAAPVTVNPVSQQEAARLAQGLYPGGPNLYRRGYYAGSRYGYPYPSPAPYYYGPVYYRPYYYSGGYYYWR